MIMINGFRSESLFIIKYRVSSSSEKYDKAEADKNYSSFDSRKEDKMTIGNLKYYEKEDEHEEF